MPQNKKELSGAIWIGRCNTCQEKVYIKELEADFLDWKKKQQDKIYREQNKKYAKKYGRFYYLKKTLEDPDYNKKRKQREKELKTIKLNKN